VCDDGGEGKARDGLGSAEMGNNSWSRNWNKIWPCSHDPSLKLGSKVTGLLSVSAVCSGL